MIIPSCRPMANLFCLSLGLSSIGCGSAASQEKARGAEVPAAPGASSYQPVGGVVSKEAESSRAVEIWAHAYLMPSLVPNQPALLREVRVVGQEKLEGVTYEIRAIDPKDGDKEIGRLASKDLTKSDTSFTLESETARVIPLMIPEIKKGKKILKGPQEGIEYEVVLKTKEGRRIWGGSFIVTAPPLYRRHRH